jgi:ribosomal protein L7/L12
MTTNPFPDKTDNVNAFELVNAINLLVETNQWNPLLRHMASNDPKSFIVAVEDFRENGKKNDNFSSMNVDVWLIRPGINKINCIKVLREIFGLGLADAKALSGAAPCKLSTLSQDDPAVPFMLTSLKDIGCDMMLRYVNAEIEPGWSKFATNVTPRVPDGWKVPVTYKLPALEKNF